MFVFHMVTWIACFSFCMICLKYLLMEVTEDGIYVNEK